MLKRNLPSRETSDRVYNEASEFSIQNNNREKFVKTTKGIGVKTASYIRKSETRVNDLEAPRVVRWAYKVMLAMFLNLLNLEIDL